MQIFTVHTFKAFEAASEFLHCFTGLWFAQPVSTDFINLVFPDFSVLRRPGTAGPDTHPAISDTV